MLSMKSIKLMIVFMMFYEKDCIGIRSQLLLTLHDLIEQNSIYRLSQSVAKFKGFVLEKRTQYILIKKVCIL